MRRRRQRRMLRHIGLGKECGPQSLEWMGMRPLLAERKQGHAFQRNAGRIDTHPNRAV